MNFVNIYGQPVSVGATPPPPKAKSGSLKRVDKAEKAKEHWGFEVVGVSLESLRVARANALARERELDEAAWLKSASLKRAIRRAYSIESSAQQAADILRKTDANWLNVTVRPILKG